MPTTPLFIPRRTTPTIHTTHTTIPSPQQIRQPNLLPPLQRLLQLLSLPPSHLRVTRIRLILALDMAASPRPETASLR